jgi:hypothetical protein
MSPFTTLAMAAWSRATATANGSAVDGSLMNEPYQSS